MAPIDPTAADQPDPQIQVFLHMLDEMDLPDVHELSPDEARSLVNEQLAMLEVDIDLPTAEDGSFDGPGCSIDYRMYDPREEQTGDSPLILYFHGGGWVLGNLDTHDGACRKLASETNWPVVSVDYRLAPEHPFPAGLKDCYRALEWAVDEASALEIDPERIVLAGDSAGGNLATATALLARDRDGPEIAHQVLVYPVTGDARLTDSFKKFGGGEFYLTAADMDWFAKQYADDEIDRGNVYALPRRAADLSDLPPATIITAGFDPLRDDGAAYARRLEDAGVPVEYRNFDDMIHTFWNMLAAPVEVDQAHQAYEFVTESLFDSLEGVQTTAD